jgi:glycosyltransferase involved in cell wall biosynthesis
VKANVPPLRILMVDSERTWRGGQGQVYLLMRGLADLGQHVTLAAPVDGALHQRAGTLPVERRAWPGRNGLRSLSVLREIIRGGGFDVVHSHASRAHGAVAVARLGVRPRAPHVVSRRVDFAIGRGFGIWKYRRGADAYLAISRGVRDVLVRGGVAARVIALVPSGIDLDKFARVREPGYLRSEFSLDGDTKVIVNVAALAPHKAQRVLLEAVARLRARGPLRCFVVGEGALRSELERFARELGLGDTVTFTGFREDALEFIRLADVFVMSSHLEGLGTSIMDAHALGAAVVATRTGGIPEIVADGQTGLLAVPGDAASLADAIARMLEDGELRAACIRRGREQAAGYDYRHMVYKTLDVYRSLCHVQPPLEGNPSA